MPSTDETFAPVIRTETLRILLAIARARGPRNTSDGCDHGLPSRRAEEEIYMIPPASVPDTEGSVCRLLKGLYGLKQSARVWNQRLTSELKRMGSRATSTT
jgi:Reverse transcriptase (RNA-dependent DNA polymerase)